MLFRRLNKRTVWALAIAVFFVVVYERLLWPGLRENLAIRKIEAMGGTVATEPGGPSWIRNSVGDEWMGSFTRVTRVVLPFDADDNALATLRGLNDLNNLSLRFANPTDAGWTHLRGLRNLQFLDLTNARFDDSGAATVKGLAQLRSLDLTNTDVTDAGLAQLKGLRQLRSLNLSNTDVTDAGLVQVAELKSLESLQLGGTKITGAGLAHLKGLSNLRVLEIGNSSTLGPASDLQSVLPNCKIRWR